MFIVTKTGSVELAGVAIYQALISRTNLIFFCSQRSPLNDSRSLEVLEEDQLLEVRSHLLRSAG